MCIENILKNSVEYKNLPPSSSKLRSVMFKNLSKTEDITHLSLSLIE